MDRIERARAFELLGIAPDSDQPTIEAAWRRLVRSYRPELAQQDRAAAIALLNRIDAAFDLLDARPAAEKDAAVAAATMQPRAASAPRPSRRTTGHPVTPTHQPVSDTMAPRRPAIERMGTPVASARKGRFAAALNAMSGDMATDVVIYV